MMLQFVIVGILLGYNLTERNNMTNQDDTFVNGFSLNVLTKFVRELHFVWRVILFCFADNCWQFNYDK